MADGDISFKASIEIEQNKLKQAFDRVFSKWRKSSENLEHELSRTFDTISAESEASSKDMINNFTATRRSTAELQVKINQLSKAIIELNDIRQQLANSTEPLELENSFGTAYSNTEESIQALLEDMVELGSALDQLKYEWDKAFESEVADMSIAHRQELLQQLITQYNELLAIQDELQRHPQATITDSTGQSWTGGEGAEALKQRMADLKYQIDVVKNSFEEIPEKANETNSALTRVQNIANLAANGLKKLASISAVLTRRGLNLLIKGFRRLNGTLWTFTKQRLGSVISRIKRILPLFSNLRKHTTNTGLSFKKLAGAMLAAGLGVRGLSGLFGKIKSAIADSLKSLAKADKTTNASISNMMTALNSLKGSFGAAFAPILNVVAPIITKFINLLTNAVNAIGMFIARLTGQSIYKKAVAVQQDYAESLQDTADAANAANDATTQYLSGLDEIRKFDTGSGSGSGGGAGAGGIGSDAGDTLTWTEVEIPDSIKSLADTLKDYFKKEDWDGLGEFVADKVNGAFEKLYEVINWDNVGPKITPAINGIVKTFNSLVSKIKWEKIGQTFGAGVNTIVNAANLLATGVNWENLGTGISDVLNGFITEVNWTNLGKTIGNFVDGVWKLFKSAVNNVKWKNLGKSVANAINGFFSTYKFSTTTGAIVTFLNGLFKALGSFSKTLKWKNIAKNIVNGINNFIKEFKWKKNGESIGLFVNDLWTTISDGIGKISWKQLGKGIAKAINGYFNKYKFSTTSGAVVNFLNGLFDALGSFATTLPWGDIADNIVQGINKFVKDFKWKDNSEKLNKFLQNLADTLGDIASDTDWEGLGEGIADFLAGVDWTSLFKKVVSAIVTAVTGIVKGLVTEPEGAALITAIAGWFTVKNVGPIISALGSVFGSSAVSESIAAGLGASIAGVAAGLVAGGVLDAILIKQGYDAKIEQGTEDIVDVDTSNMTYDELIKAREEAMTKLTAATNTLKVAENDLTVSWEYGDGQMVDYTYDMDILRARQKKLTTQVNNYDKALALIAQRKEIKTKVDLVKHGNLKKFKTAQRFVKSLDEKNAVIEEKIAVKKSGVLAREGSPRKVTKSFDHGNSLIEEKLALRKAGILDKEGSPRKATQSYDKGNSTINENVDLQKGNWAGQSPNGWTQNQVTGSIGVSVDLNMDPASEIAFMKRTRAAAQKGLNLEIPLATGGILPFAGGGIIRNMAGLLSKIPHYASGTTRPHGTMFVAGEAGPEIIGHINGQTEILNKSQLASTMYSAIVSGVSIILQRFANLLFAHLSLNTNAIVGAIAYNPSISKMAIPAIASGSALPANNAFISAVNNGLNGINGLSEQNLRQIVREESTARNYEFVAQINRRTLFDEFIQEAKLRQMQTGKNPFEFA